MPPSVNQKQPDKTAAFYALTDRIIIHAYSKTVMGLNIADEPYITLPKDAAAQEIIIAINTALDGGKTGIPHPTDWNAAGKKMQAGMGLKSWTPIGKVSTAYCSISQKNNLLAFLPSLHDGSPRSAGFEFKPDQVVEVPINAGVDEIYNALQLAVSRCN